MVVLALAAASCGEAPDRATRCANRVADIFDVRRGNVMLVDPSEMAEDDNRVTGTVDTWQSPENTRAFSCHFDADGKVAVEMHHGDSE
ncbi:MAG: hypothetical protein AB7O49_14780 [Sphingomonadales bacterium]